MSRTGIFWIFLVFALVWLATFNAAILNGDDINHFQASYGGKVFFPHFRRGWIPNRLVDLYGRSLAGGIFNLLFFPTHAVFGISFFWFYKIFSATAFAGFVAAAYGYVLLQVTSWLGRVDVLLKLLIAAALVAILPWTNEVRMICYQIPAFIGFVVILELAKRLFRFTETADVPVVILAFIMAFSLEAYSAILLILVIEAFLIMALLRRKHPEISWPIPIMGQIIFLGFCCFVAVLMTLFLSERAGASSHFAPLADYAGLIAHGHWPVDPIDLIYPVAILAGGAGLWIAVAIVRGRFGVRIAEQLPAWSMAVAILAFVTCSATLLVVGLISVQANQNYFSFRFYPWGDFLLIAEFSLVTLLATVFGWRGPYGFWAEFLRPLLVFVLLSRLVMYPLGHIQSDFQTSEAVKAAYKAMLAGNGPVISTGLKLETVPMQERPLPTANSPQWFIDGYHYVFATYYGVQSKAVFQ